MEENKIHNQDVLIGLDSIKQKSIHCCVTSPPYYGLRDYKLPPTKWPSVTFSLFGMPITIQEQECCLGLEKTPMDFVGHIVLIFRKVKNALRDDGTLWLNFGDSYAGYHGNKNSSYEEATSNKNGYYENQRVSTVKSKRGRKEDGITRWGGGNIPATGTLKAKDMIGIPWMVAFALRDDGWYLRSDVIWHKPNPMPESVNDRPTKSHEYFFLFSKSQKYYYDSIAIMQDVKMSSVDRLMQDVEKQEGSARVPGKTNGNMKARSSWNGSSFDSGKTGEMMATHGGRRSGNKDRKNRPGAPENNGAHQKGCVPWEGMKANKRSVWTVTTKPFSEAHFATFPEDLIIDCIKAGSSEFGCCSICGLPFERDFNKKLVPGPKASFNSQTDERDLSADKQDQGSNRMKDGHKPGWINQTQTVGWTKSCTCKNSSPIPSTILDPFMGAGTTAIVARKLNRNFIGFELNPDYIKIAEKRLYTELGMFL